MKNDLKVKNKRVPEIEMKIKPIRASSKGEEIEVPVKYLERTARRRVRDRGRRKG